MTEANISNRAHEYSGHSDFWSFSEVSRRRTCSKFSALSGDLTASELSFFRALSTRWLPSRLSLIGVVSVATVCLPSNAIQLGKYDLIRDSPFGYPPVMLLPSRVSIKPVCASETRLFASHRGHRARQWPASAARNAASARSSRTSPSAHAVCRRSDGGPGHAEVASTGGPRSALISATIPANTCRGNAASAIWKMA